MARETRRFGKCANNLSRSNSNRSNQGKIHYARSASAVHSPKHSDSHDALTPAPCTSYHRLGTVQILNPEIVNSLIPYLSPDDTNDQHPFYQKESIHVRDLRFIQRNAAKHLEVATDLCIEERVHALLS